MITAVKTVMKDNLKMFEFRGLSSDTKPTETYEGETIGNGSTFFEMDTQEVKFYDAGTNAWV